MPLMSPSNCSNGLSVVPIPPHRMPLSGDPEKSRYGAICAASVLPTRSERTGMLIVVIPRSTLSPLVRMSRRPSLPGRGMSNRCPSRLSMLMLLGVGSSEE